MNKLFCNITTTNFWLDFLGCTATFMFLVTILALGWYALGPKKPKADEVRQAVGSCAIESVIGHLRENRGDIKRIAVLHFRNDPTDYLTLTLRGKLYSHGTFEVEDTRFSEKLRNLLFLRNTEYHTVNQALKYAKGTNIQAVVIGDIENFESLDNGAILTGNVKMVDVQTGKVIADISINENTTNTFTNQMRKVMNVPGDKSGSAMLPWHIRLLTFAVIVLLLPAMTFSFLRFMVAKKSNKNNAIVLAIYTVVDAIVASFTIGGHFDSMVSVILFLAATVLAFIYNEWMMTFALKLES